MIYTPLKPNTAPTLGTSGDAVLALQKKLNAQGAGLKEDSLYGPLTAAAFSKYNTTPIQNPTNTQNNIQNTSTQNPLSIIESPEEKALREANARKINESGAIANSYIDEDKIKAEALAQMQAEINAQNEIYANKLREAKIAGQGRVGSGVAIQGRSGLLGSDFGNTQTQDVLTANQDVYNLIDAEKQATISALQTKARESGAAAIAAKRAAKEAGLTEYISSLTSAVENKKKQSNEIAKLILSGKLDFTNDKNVIQQAAKEAGLTVAQLKSSYDDIKRTQDVENAKLAKELKTNQPSSVQEYEYAKAGGYTGSYNDYQTLDANRKAVIAKAGRSVTGGLTPYQQFSATQSIAKDTQTRTAGAREMARQAQLIDQSYNNIVNGGDRSLNTQAIITSFNKILDPSSVVRESEYDRTAQGQSLLAQLEGKVQNIAAGGAGVTPATLKEASDIAKRYLQGAQETINTQNERARQMASQFGLNPDFVTGTYQTGGQEIIDNINPDPLGLGL